MHRLRITCTCSIVITTWPNFGLQPVETDNDRQGLFSLYDTEHMHPRAHATSTSTLHTYPVCI